MASATTSPSSWPATPAAWIEWRKDGLNHTSGDTYAHCSAAKIQKGGGLVLGFLASLRPSDLQALQTARM